MRKQETKRSVYCQKEARYLKDIRKEAVRIGICTQGCSSIGLYFHVFFFFWGGGGGCSFFSHDDELSAKYDPGISFDFLNHFTIHD